MAQAQAAAQKPNYSRKTLRKKARVKRKKRILEDKEFAKNFFEAKSKRSAARKVAFKKRHSLNKGGA